MPREDNTIKLIESVLPEFSATYEGFAVFPDSAQTFAGAIGKSKGMLYQGNSKFEDKLEVVTGLKVIHKGIVLGRPEHLTPPVELPENVKKLANEISALAPSQRSKLIARIAILDSSEEQ